jgi:hypothetical protein
MDFKQQGTRYSRKVNETGESEERYFQPGAAGVWGKYNGQLLQCKLRQHQHHGSVVQDHKAAKVSLSKDTHP